MSTKSNFCIAEFRKTSLPAEWNWKQDSQAEKFSSVSEYILLAEKLIKPSLHFMAKILVEAGYVPASKEAELLERLKSLKNKKKLDLGNVSVSWRVKSELSSNNKIFKGHKTPDQIGDYFGFKFVAKDVADVVRLRNALINSDNITSRKCEFTYPSERGYRSHKSHHVVDNGEEQLSIEAIITHADFEANDRLTHSMIEAERRILIRQAYEDDRKLSQQFAKTADCLKNERTRINHETAAAAGLNALCADDAITGCEPKPLNNWARKIVCAMAPSGLERKASIPTNNP